MTKKERKIKQRLKTLGKRCYTNCFEAAWSRKGELSESHIKKHDPVVGRDALRRRISAIRCIFRDGMQLDVLQECTVNKDHPEAAQKASELCDKYRGKILR